MKTKTAVLIAATCVAVPLAAPLSSLAQNGPSRDIPVSTAGSSKDVAEIYRLNQESNRRIIEQTHRNITDLAATGGTRFRNAGVGRPHQKDALSSELQQAMQLYKLKKYGEALQIFNALALRNPLAATMAGTMYMEGKGTKQNFARARQLLTLGANAGLNQAKSAIGLMYFAGLGVPRDYGKAYAWLAADKETASALYLQGLINERGLGVKVNLTEALRCYGRAAMKGSNDAKAALGELNYLGKGTAPNHKLALGYFEQAAAEKNPKAQLYFAEMLAKGDQRTPDIDKAKQLLDEAEQSIKTDFKLLPTTTKAETDELLALAQRVKGTISSVKTPADESVFKPVAP